MRSAETKAWSGPRTRSGCRRRMKPVFRYTSPSPRCCTKSASGRTNRRSSRPCVGPVGGISTTSPSTSSHSHSRSSCAMSQNSSAVMSRGWGIACAMMTVPRGLLAQVCEARGEVLFLLGFGLLLDRALLPDPAHHGAQLAPDALDQVRLVVAAQGGEDRSEEHTSELQS